MAASSLWMSHLVGMLTGQAEVCQVLLKRWRQEQIVALFALPWIPGA